MVRYPPPPRTAFREAQGLTRRPKAKVLRRIETQGSLDRYRIQAFERKLPKLLEFFATLVTTMVVMTDLPSTVSRPGIWVTRSLLSLARIVSAVNLVMLLFLALISREHSLIAVIGGIAVGLPVGRRFTLFLAHRSKAKALNLLTRNGR